MQQMSPRLRVLKPLLISLCNGLRLLNVFPPAVVGRRENTAYIQKILDQFLAERTKEEWIKADPEFIDVYKTLRDLVICFCDEDDGYADLFIRLCEIIHDSKPPKSRGTWGGMNRVPI